MSLNIDYERDLRQAQKLQSYADNECDTILNKLQTAKDALGQCWKGNSGTAMQEVLEERIQNMKNIQSDMRSLASRLRPIFQSLSGQIFPLSYCGCY